MGPVEWRQAPGYPRYEVSNFGWVRTKTTSARYPALRVLEGQIVKYGYTRFHLTQEDGKHVKVMGYVLVALAFIGPAPSPVHEVAHWDGKTWNAHVANLRWATPKENHADQVRHGTKPRGEKNGKSKLTQLQVDRLRKELVAEEGKIYAKRGLLAEWANRLGVSKNTIILAAKGRSYFPTKDGEV